MINEDSRYFDLNDENWSTLGMPVLKQDMLAHKKDCEEDNLNRSKSVSKMNKPKRVVLSPILTFQLIVCLFVLTLAYVSKTFFLNQYESIKNEYDKEFAASMFFDGKIHEDEYDNIFTITSDEN